MTKPTEAPEDMVSSKTAAALRAAMARLFEGRPQRTDGRLTKENLYKEAQVSRATMNRATAVLAEWDAHIAAHGKATPGEPKRDATIADLKKRLTAKTQECTLLEKKLKAAQTAIAALFHDNEAIAGVVYDDVDRAEGLERLVDDTTHSLGVGDIELGGPEPVAVLGVEVVESLGPAERGGDTVATGQEVFGEQSPEA